MQCQVCFHHCELKEGQIGSCRARMNQEGKIISLNYGQLVSLALDPIEKNLWQGLCLAATSYL